MAENAFQSNFSGKTRGRRTTTPRPSAASDSQRRSLRTGFALSRREKPPLHHPVKRPVSYQITFEPTLLPWKLFYVVVGLLAIHLILAVVHYEIHRLPWLLRQLFDLDEENNLPSWYSGTTLFLTSVFLWLCAREKKAIEDMWSRQWKILALGFFLLSLDEIAGLHESFNSLVDINWAIPGGLFALVIGFLFVPFLLDLERRTAKRFALAGTIYLGGAIVVELLAAPLKMDSLQYYMMTLWEEGMEMIGVLIFLHALLSYMSGPNRNQLKLESDLPSESAPPA